MEQYFEWDEAKNRKNQKKHDVSFETASLVFDDPLGSQSRTDIPMVKNVGKPLEK
jgi:uncharacterized DUF497 family protein